MTFTGDGHCTGFQWVEWIFPHVQACCLIHDAGGTDGTLLDCLQAALPPWAWALAALGVAVMIVFRPVYAWMQARGWVK